MMLKGSGVPLCRATRCNQFACSPGQPLFPHSPARVIQPRLCDGTYTTRARGVRCAAAPEEGTSGTVVATVASPAGASTTAAARPEPWKWEESPDALRAYGVLAAILVAGGLKPEPLMSSSVPLDLLYFISLAVTTQYIGAHRGLTTKQRQQISIKEGLLAPVAASISLFTCYLIIKFLPNLSIDTLLNAYFWLIGSFAGVGALGPVFKQLGAGTVLTKKSLGFDVPEGWLLDEEGKFVTRAEFAPTDVLAIVGALGLSTANLVTGDYSLNNLMACLIATDILQLIGIRSFRVAGAMLVGLLLYDVVWVFGSPSFAPGGDNVMLEVATSNIITGPSRLLFPRAPGGVGEAADFPFSLLGLGDVAIPGLLACLSLRYDASRCIDMRGRAQVAAAAIQEALAGMPEGASSRQIADSTAAAAEAAYDKFADRELVSRTNTTDGTNASAGSSSESSSSSSSSGQAVIASDAVLGQRTYFTRVMIAYVIGLATAFGANAITHLGQPALLYIVPATLGALVLASATRQELKQLWSFTDAPSFGLGVKPEGKAEDGKGKQ